MYHVENTSSSCQNFALGRHSEEISESSWVWLVWVPLEMLGAQPYRSATRKQSSWQTLDFSKQSDYGVFPEVSWPDLWAGVRWQIQGIQMMGLEPGNCTSKILLQDPNSLPSQTLLLPTWISFWPWKNYSMLPLEKSKNELRITRIQNQVWFLSFLSQNFLFLGMFITKHWKGTICHPNPIVFCFSQNPIWKTEPVLGF